MSPQHTGKVKFYNTDRRYGFIRPDAGGPDVHIRGSLLPEGMHLREDDRVEYDVAQEARGPSARNLRKLETPVAPERRSRRGAASNGDDRLERLSPQHRSLRALTSSMMSVGSGKLTLNDHGPQHPFMVLHRLLYHVDPGTLDDEQSLDPEPRDSRKKTNSTLALDAFVEAFRNAFGSDRGNPKGPFVEARNALESARKRQEDLSDRLCRQEGMVHTVRTYRVNWRLAIGMGEASPWENGFTLHPLLGVPYLPTSALHGLSRRGAREGDVPREDIDRTMGSTKEGRGAVTFLDALPDPASLVLERDTITVHDGKFYRGGGAPRPTDAKPVPIPFLTVGGGARFVVHLLASSGERGSLDKVTKWLDRAVLEEGAGAKTAAGYGVLEPQ